MQHSVDHQLRLKSELALAEAQGVQDQAAATPLAAGQMPAVLVMNPYYTGIGIARCLHGLGVEVVGLASERDAPGNRSRFFSRIVDVPNGRDEPQALCEALVELGRQFAERPVLLPTRDFDVLFVHDFWEALNPYYRLTQPCDSPILKMMDKLELAQAAAAAGLPTPRTAVCNNIQSLLDSTREMRFPVIMKPRFAYQWRRSGIWNRIGAQKAVIAASPGQLRREYERVESALSEVLVQEYVPGDDPDIVVCCCYIDASGELLGHFTARKLRQEPALVGTGSVVQADRVDAIIEPSVRLLRAFGYVGMAEVEYKLDRVSGSYFLIEVNPRHWDQHELGRLVGVNLSVVAFRHLTGQTQERQVPVYPVSQRCSWIAERELCMGLLRGTGLRLVSGGETCLATRLKLAAVDLVSTLHLIRGRRICSVFRWSDPKLALVSIGSLLSDAAALAAGWVRRWRSASS